MNIKGNKKHEEFDFSEEKIERIRSAYEAFKVESKKLGENIDLSSEQKLLVVEAFVNNLIDKVIKKNKSETKKKITKSEKEAFKKKIFDIINKL